MTYRVFNLILSTVVGVVFAIAFSGSTHADRFSFVFEVTEVDQLPIFGDVAHPPRGGFVPINSSDPRRVVAIPFFVFHVAGARDQAEILYPVVGPVAINMIYFLTGPSPVDIQPGQPVGIVSFPFYLYSDIPIRRFIAPSGYFPDGAPASNSSLYRENPRYRVVIEPFFEFRLRKRFIDHGPIITNLLEGKSDL